MSKLCCTRRLKVVQTCWNPWQVFHPVKAPILGIPFQCIHCNQPTMSSKNVIPVNIFGGAPDCVTEEVETCAKAVLGVWIVWLRTLSIDGWHSKPNKPCCLFPDNTEKSINSAVTLFPGCGFHDWTMCSVGINSTDHHGRFILTVSGFTISPSGQE